MQQPAQAFYGEAPEGAYPTEEQLARNAEDFMGTIKSRRAIV